MNKSWMDTIERAGDRHLGEALVRLAYEAVCEHQRQMQSQQQTPARPASSGPMEVRR
ncbi:MAG: hypothetical protein R3236_00280 [Phycisphaeraceae bacterium]|nr:hypothetical protein [Phycisphaeraceae bacterium]